MQHLIKKATFCNMLLASEEVPTSGPQRGQQVLHQLQLMG